MSNRPDSIARSRALNAVAHDHPEEFRKALNKERKKLGLPPVKQYGTQKASSK